MTNKKTDRRVQYTKMVIKDSFIELLMNKDISKITITEICELADLNRATFYAHYQDQYDLMKQIQAELIENVTNYLELESHTELAQIPVANVERIFDYIKENARICKILLGEQGDINFQKQVLALAYEKNILDLTSLAKISPEEAEYINTFSLAGAVGLIQKWLNEDLNKSSRFMAETIMRLAQALPASYKKSPNGLQ